MSEIRPRPDPDRRRRQVVRRAGVVVWRSRAARVVVVTVAIVAVSLAMYANYVYGLARAAECPVREIPDVSMETLVEIKGRLERYQVDPAVDARLELTGPEASFLLRDMLDYEVWLDVDGDRVDALVVRRDPQRGRCLTLGYQGGVEVVEGTLVLEPDRLVVGEADLTGWFAVLSPDVPATWLPDPVATRILTNIRQLDAEGGALHIQFADRWSIWQ